MTVLVDDLVNRVKVNMEEQTAPQVSFAQLTVGVDIESYIRAKLPDALLAVLSVEPLTTLPCADCASSLTPIARDDGSGMVFLPDDVWRLVEFRMAGWGHSVTRFLDTSSPEYELQHNPYTRGSGSAPVCVLLTLEGRKCIEYYSLPRTIQPQVERALYVPYPSIASGEVDIPQSVIPKVCYTCAAMVYEILGQPDLAMAMLRGIV